MINIEVYKSYNLADTNNIAAQVAKKLKSGNVVALFGSMGMGKTTFVRGLSSALNYTGEVNSPTFAIVHEYLGGDLNIYHFDMYRVNSFDDLYSTNFFEYLEMPGIVVIEWSENIQAALPDNYLRIEISQGENENIRKFSIEEVK